MQEERINTEDDARRVKEFSVDIRKKYEKYIGRRVRISPKVKGLSIVQKYDGYLAQIVATAICPNQGIVFYVEFINRDTGRPIYYSPHTEGCGGLLFTDFVLLPAAQCVREE